MSERLRHPAAGCTPSQIRAFEAIATGCDTGHHRRTIEALIRKDLIVKVGDSVLGRGAFAVTIPRYEVPIHLHMQWCAWCAENADA